MTQWLAEFLIDCLVFSALFPMVARPVVAFLNHLCGEEFTLEEIVETLSLYDWLKRG